MMTNTFTPHVGGVARSVESFTAEYRRLGHEALVVAPVFEGMPPHEEDVIRVPAIQHFSGSDFSIRLPSFGRLTRGLDQFRPQIIHSHHPFLLGGAALCEAAARRVPLVFTHHTMYEQYTHYVPGDSPPIRAFAIELATGYANLCDRVIAPSESVAAIIGARGVTTPIAVIPTGVDVRRFGRGDGGALRRVLGISPEAFVVGHVGRLAPEKNMDFLTAALCILLSAAHHTHFLVVGSGPSESGVRAVFENAGLGDRAHFVGPRDGKGLVNAYHAMDVFAFASKSETQGMVLAEAMAAGVPVVGLNAAGVREVVRDAENGRLLTSEDPAEFASALAWVAARSAPERQALVAAARKTARSFSLTRTARRALAIYRGVLNAKGPPPGASRDSAWSVTVRKLAAEWEIWSNVAHAANVALATPLSRERRTGA
jgi:glycosyltransferase involved in cell wall biosynthesis